MHLPYILLAFACADDNPMGELPALKEERLAIEDRLRGSFQISTLVPATLLRIEDTFACLRHRIKIFHYAGHANEEQVDLEKGLDGHSAGFAKGMATYIGMQKGVQLVFLNGCSTHGQVQYFLDAGISAVIATNEPIRDKVAKDFALGFYSSFSGGDRNKSLKQAFEEAKASVLSRYPDLKSLYRKMNYRPNKNPNEFPYKLHIKEDKYSHITYQDLILEETFIQSGPITHKAYLLCDRTNVNEDFKDSLENHLKANERRPLVSLVEGNESELPRILCERFYEFSIGKTFKKLDEVLNPSRFKRYHIDLPLLRDYLTPHKALDRVKYSLRENLQLDQIKYNEIREMVASTLVKSLGQHFRIVIFQHNLYHKDWHPKHSRSFFEDYLHNFWNIEIPKGAPEILLLFSFQYPKRKGIQKILPIKKYNITECFSNTNSSQLKPLNSVPYVDVIEWIDKYAPDDTMLVEELFGKNKKLPMKIVLPTLKQVVERRSL